MICAFSLCFFLVALSLTIDWPGSGPLLQYISVAETCEWTHSPIWPRTDENWHLFYSLACCNVYPKHALAKQKQDKRPVFRLFLLSSSCLVSSFQFRFVLYFCTCLYFCSIKKVPLGFLLIFFHLLFSFPSSFPIVVDAWFLLLPYCDSLGYLWDCSMCPHAVRLSCRGVCSKIVKEIHCIVAVQQFLGSTPFFGTFLLHFPRKLRKALNRNQLDRHDGIIRFARSSFYVIVYLTVWEQLGYWLCR